ncbi:MAG: GNAT family N-acetyltransferase [Chitinophagaceae bacterium]|nr:GNAT family N-acetyltransferase [Chitinophagaceae bacterium]
MNWICKPFEQLSPKELYAILQLRNDVFVVEQNCVFQDADDRDQASWHFMGWHEDRLAAYTRLLPAGISYPESSIGRVVIFPKMRKSGLGKELMERSIEMLYLLWNKQPIRIGAQLYLKKFYESFGFQQCSDIYIEDNIEHISMILQNE